MAHYKYNEDHFAPYFNWYVVFFNFLEIQNGESKMAAISMLKRHSDVIIVANDN